MPSSELPKRGDGMQTDSSSVSALPPNTDTNSGSDPKVVINLSTSSKSDLTSVLRPPAMASSHSTLEIAPKSLEQASSAPSTECKRSLDGVTPTLDEHGLVDDCLSTISADAAKATNDEAWEDYDANSDVTQHSKILKSLKSIAPYVDEDDTIFPIITAESRNKVLHLLVDNCNQVSLFTSRAVKNVGATIYNGTKVTMHGLGDVQGTSSDKYATLKLAFAGRSLKIRGLVVDAICTSINMSKPSIAKEEHGIDLTMDFKGKDVANFEISALIGLDVIARLISPNGNSEIPMKKIDDIILIQIGNKHLPFGSGSSKESAPKRKS